MATELTMAGLTVTGLTVTGLTMTPGQLQSIWRTRTCSLLLAVGALLAGFAGWLSPATAEVTAPACAVTSAADLSRLGLPLSHVAGRIAAGRPVKIIAIGSSSTAGAGASSSASSYPSRLEAELRARFPQLSITVINRGINGEEAAQMLARFDRAVMSENPDLVLWQVGTNAVLRNDDVVKVADTVRQGLDRLKTLDADIVVIDPQFAPKVIAKPDIERMVDLLSASAKTENVGYFRRFAVMRHWTETDHLPFELFVSADGIHMNDWGYGCMAKLLASAIIDSATRIPQTAHVRVEQH